MLGINYDLDNKFSFNSRVEDDESKLFELNMALPLFKMISIDEGMKNVETETDIGTNLNRLINKYKSTNVKVF